MCITTECRIDNAYDTAHATCKELQKALDTATPVADLVIRRLLADAVQLQNRISALRLAMQAEG